MERKSFRKMLLVGLMLGANLVIRCADGNIEKDEKKAKNAAATVIQAACRGALERQDQNVQENNAQELIQKSSQQKNSQKSQVTSAASSQSSYSTSSDTYSDTSSDSDDNDNNDNRSAFEQLPNTWLQSMAEYLPLNTLTNLRMTSRTCHVMSEVQLKIEYQNLIRKLAALLETSGNDVQRAFFRAARNNLSWAIQPLLGRNADINFANQYGNTALMLAASYGHIATIEALLAAGANACWINKILGKTVLMVAAENDQAEAVTVLLRVAEVREQIDACDESRETALMGAILFGHTAAVEVLIDAGANPNGIDSNGYTALMRAASGGHVAIVKILIGGGAHINMAEPRNGLTALMEAVSRDSIAGVNVLIDAQAALDITDACGKTALMMAAERGHVAILEMLIIAGASIDAVNTISGKTALMYAAEGGYMDAGEERYIATVKVLLAAGANPCCISSNLRRTALMIAAERGQVETVKVLLEVAEVRQQIDGGKGDKTALMLAAEMGRVEIVKALLEVAEVRLQIDGGKGDKTALMLAAEKGHTAIVKALIAAGASLDAAHEINCKTALMSAAQMAHFEVVEVLLAAGAKLDAVDFLGNTALTYAACHNCAETVGQLINECRRQLARDYPEAVSQMRGEELVVQFNDDTSSAAMNAVNAVFHQISPYIMRYLDEKDFAECASQCKLFAWCMTDERNIRLRQIKKTSFDAFIAQNLKQLQSMFEKEPRENDKKMIEMLEQAFRQGYALSVAQAQECSKDLDANIAGPAPRVGCAVVQARGAAARQQQADVALPACAVATAQQQGEDAGYALLWEDQPRAVISDAQREQNRQAAAERAALRDEQDREFAAGLAADVQKERERQAVLERQIGEAVQAESDEEADQPSVQELRARRAAALDPKNGMK